MRDREIEAIGPLLVGAAQSNAMFIVAMVHRSTGETVPFLCLATAPDGEMIPVARIYTRSVMSEYVPLHDRHRMTGEHPGEWALGGPLGG